MYIAELQPNSWSSIKIQFYEIEKKKQSEKRNGISV